MLESYIADKPQSRVSYFTESDIYSTGIEKPEQDLKQEKGKSAFSKDLFDCSVNSVLRESNNRDRNHLEVISKNQMGDHRQLPQLGS